MAEELFALEPDRAQLVQLLLYREEGRYELHTGALVPCPGATAARAHPAVSDCSMLPMPGDRAVTVLGYLTDVAQGGETRFPRLNITVQPRVGRLLMFASVTDDGLCDVRCVA